MLAKPLDDARLRVMTKDHLKTCYLYYLKSILSSSEAADLTRDIQDGERERVDGDRDPLSRQNIHNLALNHDREDVVEHAKLRAVELSKVLIGDMLVNRYKDMPSEQGMESTLRSVSL